jgi:hypothetical protein
MSVNIPSEYQSNANLVDSAWCTASSKYKSPIIDSDFAAHNAIVLPLIVRILIATLPFQMAVMGFYHFSGPGLQRPVADCHAVFSLS